MHASNAFQYAVTRTPLVTTKRASNSSPRQKWSPSSPQTAQHEDERPKISSLPRCSRPPSEGHNAKGTRPEVQRLPWRYRGHPMKSSLRCVATTCRITSKCPRRPQATNAHRLEGPLFRHLRRPVTRVQVIGPPFVGCCCSSRQSQAAKIQSPNN